MKYNLQGFSQEVASELNIDGLDLYLIRWFVDFKDTNQMDTKIIDGEVYYWIYHKKVSEDMPILHMQKTAIYRRLKKLCKAQIFKKTVVRERGTFTYYAIGPNYIRLISNTTNSSIAKTSTIKPPPVSSGLEVDNLCCENCRCNNCCNHVGSDNYIHADCGDLASSVYLPTGGFESISDGLMPIEDSVSVDVEDFVLNAGSLEARSSELELQESSFDSSQDTIEFQEGIIESHAGAFESPQGVINSPEVHLKSPQVQFESSKDISESLTSASKLISHSLNDENLTFEPKRDTFEFEEGSFESDRGALESNQKIEINKNNNIYNSSSDENNENTLTQLLWSFIKDLNPTFTLPDFKKWTRTFKSILYKDKRDFDEVSDIIEWIFTNKNTFWSGQITEASDLRKHYQRILAQLNAAKRALNNKVSTSKNYYNSYSTADFIEF